MYLSTGLALILGFIGVKLVLHYVHLQAPAVPEISTGVSLAVIVVVLAVTTVASLIKTRRDPTRARTPAAARAPQRRPRPHERSASAIAASRLTLTHRRVRADICGMRNKCEIAHTRPADGDALVSGAHRTGYQVGPVYDSVQTASEMT